MTINTDQNKFLEDLRRKDGNNVMTIVLDEEEHPISKEEMIKVVIKLFFKKSMEKFDFAELLCNKTQNNLFLIFLFYNYYRVEISSEATTGLLEKYEEFAINYIAENQAIHKKWSEEICARKQLKMNELKKKIQEKIIFLNYDEKVYIQDESLLDKRYLYLLNGRLKSINPLITKMFQIK